MSRQSPKNQKRRGPDESATDQQDADWGFESDESGLGLEKKLGFALVLCLLAGFSFVFYQKYRILQQENLQAENSTADGQVVEEDAAAETSGSPAQADLEPTPANRSPFYEPPDEPTPTSPPENQWLLTSEESTTPSASEQVPAADELPGGSYDPFADPGPTAPSAPPAAAPAADVPTLTWSDDPSPAAAEPASDGPESSFEWGGQATEAAAAGDEPSPFPNTEPTGTIAPLQSTEPEPSNEAPTIDFWGAQDSEPEADQEAAPFVIQPQPAAHEPETLPENSSATPLPEIAPREDAREPPAGEVDPFAAFAEPTETAEAPGPESEPTPFPAPSPSVTPRSGETATTATGEIPAWPFQEPEETTPAASQWDLPSPPAEPASVTQEPALTIEPAEGPQPAETLDVTQPSTTQGPATNSFVVDAAPQPFVPPALSAQAVFGEREITVSQSDSFWSISEREYGSSRYFSSLARYNRDRVSRPEKLQSGMSIRIPPPEVLEARFPELFQPQQARKMTITPIGATAETGENSAPSGLFWDERQQPRYRVGQRDTLSTIAEEYLGRASRWTEIYKLNQNQLGDPSTLKIGMVLKLPPQTNDAVVWPEGTFGR